MTERQRSAKQLANDDVLNHFLAEFSPPTKWSPTVWRKQYAILKNLLSDGYTHEEIKECITFARMKGRRVHSLGFVGYIIEESRQYWAQMREREAERLAMLEAQNTPVQLDVVRKPNTPGWLNVNDDIEEVE